MNPYMKTNIKVNLKRLREWYYQLGKMKTPIHRSWKSDYGADYFEEGSEGYGWSLHGFENNPTYSKVEWKVEESMNHPMLRSKGVITLESGEWFHVCNSHYTKRRDIVKDTYMGDVLDFFGGSYRGITWAMKPGFKFVTHVDYPVGDMYRMHIPLYTNEDSWFQIEEEKFHMPADGYVWMMNAGDYEHTAWNAGTTDRVHVYWQMPPSTSDWFTNLTETI